MGESIVWLIILFSILICDGVAFYLYKKKSFPIWGSALVIAILVPIIVISFISIGIDYNKKYNPDPDYTGDGIGIAGLLIAIVLILNAIFMFLLGVIINIYTLVKKKQWL